MKLKLFFVLLFVSSMVSSTVAAEADERQSNNYLEEQFPGRAFTQDEVLEVFCNCTWMMSEEFTGWD